MKLFRRAAQRAYRGRKADTEQALCCPIARYGFCFRLRNELNCRFHVNLIFRWRACIIRILNTNGIVGSRHYQILIFDICNDTSASFQPQTGSRKRLNRSFCFRIQRYLLCYHWSLKSLYAA